MQTRHTTYRLIEQLVRASNAFVFFSVWEGACLGGVRAWGFVW